MTRDELLADAQKRQADAQAQHQHLQQQMITLNTQGVDLEKALIGIAGEIKALSALGDG